MPCMCGAEDCRACRPDQVWECRCGRQYERPDGWGVDCCGGCEPCCTCCIECGKSEDDCNCEEDRNGGLERDGRACVRSGPGCPACRGPRRG